MRDQPPPLPANRQWHSIGKTAGFPVLVNGDCTAILRAAYVCGEDHLHWLLRATAEVQYYDELPYESPDGQPGILFSEVTPLQMIREGGIRAWLREAEAGLAYLEQSCRTMSDNHFLDLFEGSGYQGPLTVAGVRLGAQIALAEEMAQAL